MMKLYYSKGTCSLAVRIALHEMNIPCEFEAVDLKAKKTEHGADYLKINLKGSVPALLDGQELITENAVIQQYLADKHKATHMLPPVDELKRYRVLEWLNHVSSDLHKACGPFFNPNITEEMKENIFRPLLKNKLSVVEQHLQKNNFLTGEQFTLPDGYLFVVLTWLPHTGLDIQQWPNLQRYFNTIKQRKAVQQSLQEEGITL